MAPPESYPAASRSKDFGVDSREKQLIALTAAGYTIKESARKLGTSEQIIQKYLRSIYEKLMVSDDLEMILFSLYHELVDAVELPSPDQLGGDRM